MQIEQEKFRDVIRKLNEIYARIDEANNILEQGKQIHCSRKLQSVQAVVGELVNSLSRDYAGQEEVGGHELDEAAPSSE